MVNIYVSLIIKGKKKIEDVPRGLKTKVKSLLIEAGYKELTLK